MIVRAKSAMIAAAATALILGGRAVSALRAAPADAPAVGDRPTLQVRYEVRRPPVYVPPPPTESTRLEVLSAQAPTAVEEGVLSAQAGELVRASQAQDAARTASALASLRAEDARIDRESASDRGDDRAPRQADATPEPSGS